tara:strand:- start:755 stop:1042 length:288 start_codon:yes stop_codon:yes gene_type:complete
MEDFEARAREREKEINARRDIDPRDEKGLIKVEDHKHLGRDPKSNAIVNTDKVAYEAYIKARVEASKKRDEVLDLKDEITELKSMLQVLVEKSDK